MADIKQQIKALISEAEIYKSQGLVDEAKAKYESAADLIRSIPKIKNRGSLLSAIESKIGELQQDQSSTDKEIHSQILSPKAQNLIKNLFVASDEDDPDDAALQGAIVLAKLGQFDSAIREFAKLIEKDNVRVAAAKNIIQCHLARTSEQDAIEQYKKWTKNGMFPPKQLETVRQYLEEILQQKGLQQSLPALQAEKGEKDSTAEELEMEQADEEEFIDITSIGITFEHGSQKGKTVEFDVNFQSGNMLSLIISKDEADIIEGLDKGMELKAIQFYSPIAIFSGSGVVVSKTKINSGPKQGDLCLDIRITST